MSKKKNLLKSGEFGNSQSPPSMDQVTDDMYGWGNIPPLDSIEPSVISIADIEPDPVQPRKAIPNLVRRHWQEQHYGNVDIFTTWELAAQDESGRNFSVKEHLPGMDIEHSNEAGSIEQSLIDLISLARSIQDKGLINPITVYKVGEVYRLETGERRWMAYQLLDVYLGGWTEIPARVIDSPSVWRQAAENGARQNLNAVGVARQIALLLMEMYRQEQGTTFEPLQLSSIDQQFYAQVADGETWRVLRGYGDMLLGVTGLKNRSQFSRYRSLLQLPDYLWQVADDLNWTEGMVRQLRNRAGDDEELLKHLVAIEIEKENYTLPFGNISINPRYLETTTTLEKKWKRASKSLKSAVMDQSEFKRWQYSDPDAATDYLDTLRKLIDDLEG